MRDDEYELIRSKRKSLSIEIRADGTIADYLCNYEEYLEKTK